MLRLSRKVDYGLAFLSSLADEPGAWVPLADVAKERGISVKFLSQLAGSLKSAGLVTSREGVGGGYRLAQKPSAIDLKEVIEALEGDTSLQSCLVKSGSCPIEKGCTHKPMWMRIQKRLDNMLSDVSIETLRKESLAK